MADPVTVAFPLIGAPLPRLPCSPESFRDQVMRAPPHWIYHLRIEVTPNSLINHFRPVSPQLLRHLTDRLGLQHVGFTVSPQEFCHGQIPFWEADVSPYSFALSGEFPYSSSLLALAVGLVAAATGQPLPPTVLFSGVIPAAMPDTLRLARTDAIEDKARLSIGRDPGFDLAPILNQLYPFPYTIQTLGPHRDRVRPGEVKLLLIPKRVDRSPREWSAGLVATSVQATLNHFGQPELSEVLAAVEHWRAGGLLVVQVPTVFHALRLLGFHHHSPFLRERTEHLQGQIEVFRVEHQGAEATPTRLDAECDHEQRMVAQLLAEAHDMPSQLRAILYRCQEHLDADLGHICVVRDPLWLEVLARVNGRIADSFVPALPGITGRALREGTNEVVLDTHADPDYQEAISGKGPWARIYGEERWQRYVSFLERIRACVKLPLRYQERVLGLLCLCWMTPQVAPPRVLPLLQTLADCAAGVLADHEEQARLALVAGSIHDLARRMAELPRGDVRAELTESLAQLAYERSEAVRASVSLITPDGQSLETVAWAGPEDAWPPDGPLRTRPLGEGNTAARHAIDLDDDYIVQDIAGESLTGARAAILLRVGGHVLGVLEVDWPQPHAGTPLRLELLRGLASRYALALKTFATDDLLSRLETQCAEAMSRGTQPDMQKALALIAEMVGAREGAVFVRCLDSGRYQLAAELSDSGAVSEGNWCDPGQGVTGWVIHKNRAARIANLDSADELRRLDPDDPPIPHHPTDGSQTGGLGGSYLAVPLAIGPEVHGALRLAAKSQAAGFGNYDLVIARTAADRLAGVLVQQAQARRTEALLRLAAPVTRPEGPGELAVRVLAALVEGIGACDGRVWLVQGDSLQRLAATSVEVWEGAAERCLPGQGVAGKAWQQGRMEYEDARNDPELASEVPGRDGCGAAVGLQAEGECVGVLHVHRAHRRALTPGDLDFLHRVAAWAGPILGRLRAQEQRDRLDADLVAQVVEAHTVWAESPTEQPDRLTAMAETLRELVQGGDAWLWALDNSASFFLRIKVWGPEDGTPTEVPAGTIRAQVGNALLIEESDTDQQSRLSFLDGVAGAAPPRVALPLYPRADTLGAVLVVKRSLDVATRRLLQAVLRLLRHGSAAPVT